MERLMARSDNLFIFATSVVRYIDETGTSPDEQLRKFLCCESLRQPAFSELYSLYHQVLGQCADTECLRLILGTIIFPHKPPPLPVLWILHQDRIEIQHLRGILQLLGSVLLIPDNEREPIMIFHDSFVDFLTDKERSGEEFYIDPDDYMAKLKDRCEALVLSDL
jgi:hypothetical protein